MTEPTPGPNEKILEDTRKHKKQHKEDWELGRALIKKAAEEEQDPAELARLLDEQQKKAGLA